MRGRKPKDVCMRKSDMYCIRITPGTKKIIKDLRKRNVVIGDKFDAFISSLKKQYDKD